MSERGRTLIELIVVAAIVGLVLGAVGQGLVAAAGRYQGQAVVSELAGELRAARFLALMRRERVAVTIDPKAARARVALSDRPEATLREYDFAGRGVALEGAEAPVLVRFYPSGRSATPLTLRLRRGDHERWTLTVSMTGRVSVQ